ncbi:MAG: hypothetical protein WB474_03865 [Nitrososphaeraceae archaeon]
MAKLCSNFLLRESQEAIVIILRNPDAKVDALQKSQATRYQISWSKYKYSKLEH